MNPVRNKIRNLLDASYKGIYASYKGIYANDDKFKLAKEIQEKLGLFNMWMITSQTKQYLKRL